MQCSEYSQRSRATHDRREGGRVGGAGDDLLARRLAVEDLARLERQRRVRLAAEALIERRGERRRVAERRLGLVDLVVRVEAGLARERDAELLALANLGLIVEQRLDPIRAVIVDAVERVDEAPGVEEALRASAETCERRRTWLTPSPRYMTIAPIASPARATRPLPLASQGWVT